MELSVAQAAQQLQVSDARVRTLLRSGALPGRRIGRQWLVQSEDLALRVSHGSRPGRPLAPARAWALLDLLDGGQGGWLSPIARSQVKLLLRRLEGASSAHWRAALRGRSEVQRCWAHQAAIKQLLAEPGGGVLSAGPREAVRLGVDLVVLDAIAELYIDPLGWPPLAEHLAISRNAHPANLVVRLPHAAGPFTDHRGLSAAMLAADLCESADPRALQAGADRLNELTRQFCAGR